MATVLACVVLPATASATDSGYTSISPDDGWGNYCLDVANSSTADGANVQDWGCWGGANQQWDLVSTGTSGYYEIVDKNSGKCLDVANSSTADGANVQQWGCWNGSNQLWQPRGDGAGQYQLVNKNSGKCLDSSGSTASNGDNVQQWGCWGGLYQQWQLTSHPTNFGDNANDNCTSWTAGSGDPSNGGTLPTCNGWSSDSFANYGQWGFNYYTAMLENRWATPGTTAYERVFVPWDTLGYYNTSTGACDWSPAYRGVQTLPDGHWGGWKYSQYASNASAEFSPDYAGQDWQHLLNQLKQIKTANDNAQANGYGAVEPLIVIGAGTGVGGQGGASMYNQQVSGDPVASGNLVPSWPDASSIVDKKDYFCGLDYLMYWLGYGHAVDPADYPQVNEYEALNEPDGAGYSPRGGNVYDSDAQPDANNYGSPYSPYNGSTGGGNSQTDGEWKAGYLWYLAQTAATYLHRTQSIVPALDIAAYTGTHPNNNPYFDAYYRELSKTVSCTSGYACQQPMPGGPSSGDYPTKMPFYWAVHDYLDDEAQCSGCGTADIKQFTTEIGTDNMNIGPSAVGPGTTEPVWVTESGVHLDERTGSDLNYPSGISCSSPDNPNGLGCLVDDNDAAQQRGAQNWLNMANAGSFVNNGWTARVTELLWYQFQLQSGNHAWDSALLDGSGNPRASFSTIANCCTAAHNASDYESLNSDGSVG